MEEGNSKDKYMLQSVTNALRIIELLADKGEMNAASVAQSLSIGKSTAFRLLSTLEMRHFVNRDNNARYRLGIKFSYFGTMALERLDIIRFARPFLEKIYNLTGADAHLAIWDEHYNIRFIDKVPTNNPMGADTYIGYLTKCYTTAVGKVLLAYLSTDEVNDYLDNTILEPQTPRTITNSSLLRQKLDDIRKSGVCTSQDEDELGFTCIAAPIFYREKVIAAISITGINSHMSREGDLFRDMVIDTAAKISSAYLR